MKKIIDGKIYNTKTADEIASYDNGLGRGDFRARTETLYRTKNGRFFLAGEGGPMTSYARSCGDNSWTGGSAIVPLSRKEALAWCEDNDAPSTVIEEYFSDLIEEA